MEFYLLWIDSISKAIYIKTFNSLKIQLPLQIVMLTIVILAHEKKNKATLDLFDPKELKCIIQSL